MGLQSLCALGEGGGPGIQSEGPCNRQPQATCPCEHLLGARSGCPPSPGCLVCLDMRLPQQ